MVREIHLFAARATGSTDSAFAAVVSAAGRALGARTVFRIDDVMKEIVHVEATATAPRPAEAILTWVPSAGAGWRDDAAVLEAFAGPGCLDRGRSSLFEGERHDVVPGSGSVLISFALQRLARLDRAGFQSYWLDHHADHGRRTLIPPNTYAQIHAQPGDGTLENLSAELSIPLDQRDGIAECLFPDVAAFLAQMARAEVAVEALEDEKNFIDHARSTFGLYRVQRA